MSWRCAWCGKPHDENNPPCTTCGYNAFEQDGVDDRPSKTVDTGTAFVWQCSNCGRNHVKNSPPCSRCGNPTLEKVEQTYEDVERDLSTPSWLEVAKPYLPAFALLAVVLFLFASGIISPSIIPGIGSPTPPDAPGNETEAAGIDLEETASLVHESLEAERASNETRTLDSGLTAYATYHNRLAVLEAAGEEPGSAPNPSEFDPACGGSQLGTYAIEPADLSGSIETYEDESALATALTDILLLTELGSSVGADFESEGLDIHVDDDGGVFMYYATC